jgi:hypothetical protein
MITPKLNINGTSAQDLIDPRQRAWKQIGELIGTLKQITPNGRDYPGNAVACTADREEHYARIAALRALQAELLREAVAIEEQELET